MRFAITVFHLNISSRIFENVTGKWTFSSNSFFFGQIFKVAIIKTKSATIAVFLFSSFLPPRSFFFSFPFPSLAWFWNWSRPQNLSFDAFHSNHRKFR